MKNRSNHNVAVRGFSLVELIVVMAIVMIIAAIFETNSRVALVSGAVFMIVLTAAYFLLKKQRDKRTID